MPTIVYRNQKYGFRLDFPLWWRRRAFVVRRKCTGEDIVACIEFRLRYRRPIQGISSTTIFEVYIFRLSEKEWRRQYKDSPFFFLAARNGFVFAAIHPGEPPSEFLLPDGSDFNRNILEFQWLLRMINEDLPVILKSFRFI